MKNFKINDVKRSCGMLDINIASEKQGDFDHKELKRLEQ